MNTQATSAKATTIVSLQAVAVTPATTLTVLELAHRHCENFPQLLALAQLGDSSTDPDEACMTRQYDISEVAPISAPTVTIATPTLTPTLIATAATATTATPSPVAAAATNRQASLQEETEQRRNHEYIARELVVIDASFNRLHSLEHFHWCTNLRLLDLSNNQVAQLPNAKFWNHLPSLQVLRLANNRIDSVHALLELASLRALEVLDLRTNPVSFHPHYRHVLVNSLAQLKLLDTHIVADEEVIEDANHGEQYHALSDRYFLDLDSLFEDVNNPLKRLELQLRLVRTTFLNNSPIVHCQSVVRGYLARKHVNKLRMKFRNALQYSESTQLRDTQREVLKAQRQIDALSLSILNHNKLSLTTFNTLLCNTCHELEIDTPPLEVARFKQASKPSLIDASPSFVLGGNDDNTKARKPSIARSIIHQAELKSPALQALRRREHGIRAVTTRQSLPFRLRREKHNSNKHHHRHDHAHTDKNDRKQQTGVPSALSMVRVTMPNTHAYKKLVTSIHEYNIKRGFYDEDANKTPHALHKAVIVYPLPVVQKLASVVKVQSVFRGFLCRKRLRETLAAAMEHRRAGACLTRWWRNQMNLHRLQFLSGLHHYLKSIKVNELYVRADAFRVLQKAPCAFASRKVFPEHHLQFQVAAPSKDSTQSKMPFVQFVHPPHIDANRSHRRGLMLPSWVMCGDLDEAQQQDMIARVWPVEMEQEAESDQQTDEKSQLSNLLQQLITVGTQAKVMKNVLEFSPGDAIVADALDQSHLAATTAATTSMTVTPTDDSAVADGNGASPQVAVPVEESSNSHYVKIIFESVVEARIRAALLLLFTYDPMILLRHSRSSSEHHKFTKYFTAFPLLTAEHVRLSNCLRKPITERLTVVDAYWKRDSRHKVGFYEQQFIDLQTLFPVQTYPVADTSDTANATDKSLNENDTALSSGSHGSRHQSASSRHSLHTDKYSGSARNDTGDSLDQEIASLSSSNRTDTFALTGNQVHPEPVPKLLLSGIKQEMAEMHRLERQAMRQAITAREEATLEARRSCANAQRAQHRERVVENIMEELSRKRDTRKKHQKYAQTARDWCEKQKEDKLDAVRFSRERAQLRHHEKQLQRKAREKKLKETLNLQRKTLRAEQERQLTARQNNVRNTRAAKNIERTHHRNLAAERRNAMEFVRHHNAIGRQYTLAAMARSRAEREAKLMDTVQKRKEKRWQARSEIQNLLLFEFHERRKKISAERKEQRQLLALRKVMDIQRANLARTKVARPFDAVVVAEVQRSSRTPQSMIRSASNVRDMDDLEQGDDAAKAKAGEVFQVPDEFDPAKKRRNRRSTSTQEHRRDRRGDTSARLPNVVRDVIDPSSPPDLNEDMYANIDTLTMMADRVRAQLDTLDSLK
jgi:Leucine-rich repeat/IQ calmodulin-binding motif